MTESRDERDAVPSIHTGSYTECMSSTAETTIRLPVELRDAIRAEASSRGLKQADVIALALRELGQAEFLRSVSSVRWDDEAAAEAREWDDAPLATGLDPWEPGA